MTPLKWWSVVVCTALLELQAADRGLTADYMVRSWQSDHGLPQNSVRGIISDRQGYLWFGTEDGLVRFDGARFAVYDSRTTPGFSQHFVWSTARKANGEGLWIGTDGSGLLEWTEGHLRVAAFAGQLRGVVTAICSDRSGALWIGSRDGLSRVQNGAVQTWRTADGLAHDYVRCIYQDAAEKIWIGTAAGLNFIESGRLEAAPWDQLTRAHVRAICETATGDLLFGTNGEGLFRASNNNLSHYTVDDGLGHNVVAELANDAEGAVWIATYGGGITRLKNDDLLSIGPEDGLPNGLCLSVYPDALGNIWIGHNGGGLSCLLPRRVRMLGREAGLAADIILPILQTKSGDIWVGTATAGVTRLRNGQPTHFDATNGLPRNVVLGLGEDREGGVWIGTAGGGGVARFHNDRFTLFTHADGLTDNTITCILADRLGRVWLGTDTSGINVYDGRKFAPLRRADGLSNEGIYCMLESRDGDIWIGTQGGGLNRYRNGSINAIATGPGTEQVQALHEDADGRLWAGTAGGLVRISRGDQVSRVTTAEGLHENQISAVVEDGEGYFWLSSNHGIFRVGKQELMAVCDGRAARVHPLLVGKADGMATAECNGGVSPSAARLQNGEIWFPTVRGIAVIAPGATKNRDPMLPAIIESLTVDEQPLDLGAAIRLPASSRHLEFSCTVPAFRAPERVRFRYRLDGFDEKWSAPTASRTAHYTRLPAGNYTFRVASAGESGVWNPAETAVLLRVIPPFYQTKLFYAAAVCAAMGAAFGFYYLRVSHLHRRNAELEQRVRERTAQLEAANDELESFSYSVSHDLRAPLRHVHSYVGLLKRVAKEQLSDKASGYLKSIGDAAVEMNTLIDDLLAFSRMNRADMLKKPVDLHAMSEETVDRFQMETQGRNIDWKIAPLPVVVGDASMLRQALINLVGNAVKYTRQRDPAEIEIGCAGEEDGRAILFVRDNGAGFDMQYAHKLFGVFQRLHQADEFEGTGIGLATVRRVVSRHGGRVWAKGAVGKGATFYFTLPRAAKNPAEPTTKNS